VGIIMDNSTLTLCESKIFKIIYQELRRQGIDYICDLGFREFLENGDSFGICSNLIWKKKKLEKGYNDSISIFYSHELLRLNRYQYSHSIRVQGFCYNDFLKKISEHNLGNVLVIYIFKPRKITGYYFLAKGNDFDAVNKFHNDKSAFEKVIKESAFKIDEVVKKHEINKLAMPLLPRHVTQELFSNNNIIFNDITNFNKSIILTPKQKEVLGFIMNGCTKSKEIASQIGFSTKQADKHISALKSIFRVNGRCELVTIAKNNPLYNRE
jgi:DNA-binding CsgD family transcriptional regulator